MALTRKSLKAMGLTDEQVESIVESHGETVSALKDEIEDLKGKVSEFEKVKKERDDSAGFKKKYDDLTKEYEEYKSKVQGEAEKTAKETAVRAYFEGKGITGKNLTIAMRGSRDEIASLKLKDGKIEDSSTLDALVSGDFADLIVKTETKGAKTATPPANDGGKGKMTKEDIFKIEDDKARYKAIADNMELFDN